VNEARAVARRLVVRGRVQGVGDRYAAVGTARDAGLAGWVRNRHDNSVEVFVQGAPAAVDAFVAWCRSGPPHARVTEVECSSAEPDPVLAGFAARPTG
jgi:acylphosphatase